MPVITTNEFQEKASRLLFGAVSCVATLAVVEYFLFSYIAVVGCQGHANDAL